MKTEYRIGIAVCLGMLAYRIIVEFAWASWYYSWFGHQSQESMLIAMFVTVAIAIASAWLWRSRRA